MQGLSGLYWNTINGRSDLAPTIVMASAASPAAAALTACELTGIVQAIADSNRRRARRARAGIE